MERDNSEARQAASETESQPPRPDKSSAALGTNQLATDHQWGAHDSKPADACPICQIGIERACLDHAAGLHHPDDRSAPLDPGCPACDAWREDHPRPRTLGLSSTRTPRNNGLQGTREGCRYWTNASGWNCPGKPLVLAYLSSSEIAKERTLQVKALCLPHYEELARLRDWRIVGAAGPE